MAACSLKSSFHLKHHMKGYEHFQWESRWAKQHLGQQLHQVIGKQMSDQWPDRLVIDSQRCTQVIGRVCGPISRHHKQDSCMQEKPCPLVQVRNCLHNLVCPWLSKQTDLQHRQLMECFDHTKCSQYIHFCHCLRCSRTHWHRHCIPFHDPLRVWSEHSPQSLRDQQQGQNYQYRTEQVGP